MLMRIYQEQWEERNAALERRMIAHDLDKEPTYPMPKRRVAGTLTIDDNGTYTLWL